MPDEIERLTELEQLFKEFAEELYFRAAAAKGRDERMAIKGVQHSLERVLERRGKTSFVRNATANPSKQG